MKRRWMVWPLALGMVLLLAACGGGKKTESLVGSWTGQVDMMDQVVEGMNLTAPEIAQELEMEAFNLTLEMEFRDDNTYTMTVDQDKLDESIEELIQKTVDATLDYLEQELKDQGITDMTVDEALAQSGMDRESFTQLMRDSLSQLSTTVAEGIQTEGQYRWEDGQLYTSDSVDVEPGSDDPLPCTLDGDTMTKAVGNSRHTRKENGYEAQTACPDPVRRTGAGAHRLRQLGPRAEAGGHLGVPVRLPGPHFG